TTLEVRQGLTLAEYAAHGGGFPLTLRGSGCLGAIVLSGLTQPEDHETVVTAVAEILGVTAPRLEI
ncbi:MAG: heme-binding protein, partial [Acidobacteria bacterium]|nr:heme-binding protein [Acidobacteriota bacterium]